MVLLGKGTGLVPGRRRSSPGTAVVPVQLRKSADARNEVYKNHQGINFTLIGNIFCPIHWLTRGNNTQGQRVSIALVSVFCNGLQVRRALVLTKSRELSNNSPYLGAKASFSSILGPS